MFQISAMTKEKTALVIPNAIQLCTRGEKLFFCSFTTRPVAHPSRWSGSNPSLETNVKDPDP